ncbi:PRA1 family protein F3 [Cicer arietinum]|uniref:PRA1 family protein n=1 Tax=Cicer arietinum TaxID=3827 RepID=A0A1S2YV00_CICAR|nr:PRA1 family protein F3 [Cicer arietinum]
MVSTTMTTTYGTIPTPPKLEYIARGKQRIKAGLGTRRAWKTMFDLRSLGIPSNIIPESISRIRVNISYFRMNYTMVLLLILFLSLLWHPISLIVFVLLMAAWLFLYFLRDQPVILWGRLVDDRLVVVLMAFVTVALLLLTHATVNIVVAVFVALLVVLVHAVFRKTEDLLFEEEEEVIVSVAS